MTLPSPSPVYRNHAPEAREMSNWTEDERMALTGAAQAFCNRGLTIACPWEGDLDGRERELFDALVAAINSYNALSRRSPPSVPDAEVEAAARAICFERSGTCRDCRWGCTPDTGCLGPIDYETRLARAALAAASSIRAQDKPVKVKELEWSGDFAHTKLGLFYYVNHATGAPGHVILEKHEGSLTLKSAWDTVQAAQAAAQADYEQRILSSLEPALPVKVPDGWQPIETAPKDGSNVLLYAGGVRDYARFVVGHWGKALLTPAQWFDYSGLNPLRQTPTHWCPLTPPVEV